jgi:hypothetical protein
MKYILSFFLTFSVLCTPLSAVELGYLTNYDGNNTITLSQSQILELTSVAGNKGGTAWASSESGCFLLIAYEGF